MLNKNIYTFILYILSLNLKMKIIIYLAKNTRIFLKNIKNILNSITAKDLDFINMFLKNLTIKLFNCLNIKKYIIDKKNYKQLLYKPIYSIRLIELKMLKTYIKINLMNKFIYLFKFLSRDCISFIKKSNNSLYMCINY